MRILFVATLLFAAPLVTFAQEQLPQPVDKRGGLTLNETRNHIATQAIKHLKNGSLLVRLQSREQAIASLIDRGDTARAERMKKDQEAKNLEIVLAFASHFDFCPVYFFYAEDSRNIRSRQFDQVTFLNQLLEPDTITPIAGGNFLVAELGKSQPRVSDTFEWHYVNDRNEWVVELYDNPNKKAQNLSGIVVMSNQLQRLSSPFPYLVRNFGDTFLRLSPKATVKRFNKKLNAFARNQGL